jgi:putative ABC transport system substrate-binding protein
MVAQAQQTERMRLIGVLGGFPENDPEHQRRFAALLQGLRELRWIEGKNLRIEYRWVTNDVERRSANVQELINLHPDLLLADNVNPPAIVALQKETATIPILFVNTADPTDQGIAPSLSRPRGNVTGFTNFEYSIGGKWMDLLKQIAPNVARAAVVFNPDTAPHGFSFARAFEAAAASFGVEPITMAVRDLAEMERTVAALGKGNGLIVIPDTFMATNRKTTFALVSQYQLPAIFGFRFYASEGGLMSFGPDFVEMHRRGILC